MRINIYAEELPDERRVEQVSTVADTGRKFFGARIYLKSPDSLHDDGEDDDRSAVTFWGPREKVAALLEEAALAMRRGTLLENVAYPTRRVIEDALAAEEEPDRGEG